MGPANDFDTIFSRLKAILTTYALSLHVCHDEPGHYYLKTAYSEKWKKALLFGSAITQKNYVSSYLMPVYMYPDLLEGTSPTLRKRMQGKSCFNFKVLDEALLAELEVLTRRGFERFQQEGLV